VNGLVRVEHGVLLTGETLHACRDLVLIGCRSRRLSGLPDSRLYGALADALTQAASANGHTDVPETVVVHSSVQPTVTIGEAAHMLKLSPRQSRRLAPKLGGRKRAGRWLLDGQAIREHMQGART
jgi:hypothetical protein